MKRLLTVVCCIGLASMSSFAQKKTAAAEMTDAKFVDFAAQTDMVEANLGQLASTAGDTQAVKDFGQMLVADHTKDFGELNAAAQKANVPNVPTAIDAAHNKSMIEPFQKLKGAAFDHKFAQEMVAGHTKAIQMYQMEAASGQNPALKSYAETALPVLQKHLAAAKELLKSKSAAK